MSIRSFVSVISLFIVSVMSGNATAWGGEIGDLAAKAERLLQQGKPVAAYETLDAAMDKLWRQMPLTVRKATFVADKPGGFGIYNPRQSAVFKPGEAMVVYLELAGFGHRSRGGVNEIVISGDVAIADANGEKTLASMPGFLKSRVVSRRKNKEFFVHLTIELSGAPAGRYQLLLTLKDKVSGKTAAVRLPFEIRG